MPYIPDAERERERWMTLADAVAHVMQCDGCDRRAALAQIRALLADHPFATWEDEPSWPDISGRYVMAGPWAYFDAAGYWAMRVRDGRVCDPRTGRWRVLLLPRMAILKSWPAAAAADQQPPRPKRDVPRIDHRDADASVVTKMRKLIASGAAKNATDAARKVAGRAPGNATDNTKVRRLVSRYGKAYPRD